EINVQLSVFEGTKSFSIIVQYKNRIEEVHVTSIDNLVIDIDDATRICTGWDGEFLRFFRNGFHSWELSQSQKVQQGKNLSHFFSLLNNTETGNAIILGYATLADYFSEIAVYGRDNDNERLAQVVASCATDSIPVTEKDVLLSEELVIIYSKDPLVSIREYFDKVKEKMNALSSDEIPTGWSSWYHYFTQVSTEEIVQNTEFLKERFHPCIKWIQIDDGYQKTVGDWEVNNRFGEGLENIVKKIHNHGFEVGIWLAPFIATEHSKIFKDKPDWFIRNQDNEPLVAGQNPLWLGNYYALDLSNPKVISHIKDIFRKFVSYGFDYFKIDFLHHATNKGHRYDTKVSRAQALRKGLETIREVVGDKIIIGCGAPLGPSVGVVDIMRVGTNIGTAWRYDWGGGVYECSVNTLTRSVMHNRLWKNDPDCILVRQDDNELSLEEVKLWLNVVAVSGGPMMISENMTELSDDRLDLLDKLLPPYGKGGVALDIFEKSDPSVFVLPIRSPIGTWIVAAFVNLTEKTQDVSFNLEKIGFDGSERYHVFDFWKQEYLGITEKEVCVSEISPHSSKLLLIRAQLPEPTILSTSMHFTQGAVELSNLEWNQLSRELSVTVTRGLRKVESIFVVFGNEWIPAQGYINDTQVELEMIATEVVAIKDQFTKGDRVKIKFTK
ncbi:MAG: alpha-galactosidase, partial [Candidatus Thorarchaeota archaeon]